MATRKPFTTQYRWLSGTHDADFIIRAHRLLTALWATIYAGLALIDWLTVGSHVLSSTWASVLDLVLFSAMLSFTWQWGLYIDKRPGKNLVGGKW
jgi:hypothetical protein